MVNREEVAKKCGVSPMTVSRVVNKKGYVSEATKIKVNNAIESLGYIPNKLASSFVRKLGNEIAIILPDLINPYYLQVIDAMIREAKKYGYIISIFKANQKELPEILQNVISMRVAGIVNYSSPFPHIYEKPLREIGTKVVRENILDAGFKMEVSYREAIFQAVKQLKDNGKKNIVFVSGMDKEYTLSDNRSKNYNEALIANGMKLNDIYFGDYPNEKAFNTGERIAHKILLSKNKIDAVFCMNDTMAFGFITGIKRHGLRVPEDIAVIGFDNISMSEFFEPPVSSIAIDTDKEAKMYIEYIAGCNNNNMYEIKAEFIKRKSSGI